MHFENLIIFQLVKEIPSILQNPKAYYHVYKILALVPCII